MQEKIAVGGKDMVRLHTVCTESVIEGFES